MKMGDNVFIAAGVYIEYPEKMQVGDHVSIQHYCFISCYGGVKIGSDVSIAHGVSIITSTHPLHGGGAIRQRPLEVGSVKIGDDVWVGMKASIMMGVEIGSGTVIGAHSLVNKTIDPGVIVAGAPARVLRRRECT
jgi:acetyltransferase-like isoleucine patch superfamily enzyme